MEEDLGELGTAPRGGHSPPHGETIPTVSEEIDMQVPQVLQLADRRAEPVPGPDPDRAISTRPLLGDICHMIYSYPAVIDPKLAGPLEQTKAVLKAPRGSTGRMDCTFSMLRAIALPGRIHQVYSSSPTNPRRGSLPSYPHEMQ
jgi:hypothetical protein